MNIYCVSKYSKIRYKKELAKSKLCLRKPKKNFKA